jgi:glucose/arabinose dehydrogenase
MHRHGRAALRTLGSAALLIGTAGCSDADPSTPAPTPGDPAEARLELVVDGLQSPILLTHAPGDSSRLFVLEQPGRIRVIRDGTLLSAPFLDIASITSDGGERGLLGLAFHPDYASNGHFFVNHTDTNGDTRILRFVRGTSDDVADPGALEVVLEVSQPFSNHNGGHLAFGPDGMLYAGLGDGGSGGDPEGNGQDPSTLLGSMLRISVDALPYTVPSDNPFVGMAGFAPETWAYGLRNPWRFSFDRTTGDLWIADVGQSEREEISVQAAASPGGENYGWNRLEGSACYPREPCDSSGTVLPAYEYTHGEGCSITGGYVYRGTAVSALTGRYLFADYCTGWVRSLGYEGGMVTDVVDHAPVFGSLPGVVSFGEDAAGEVYVVSLAGSIYRIVDPD